MPSIEEALQELNPWWEGRLPPPARPRILQPEVGKLCDRHLAVALTGLRRVGKTTMLLQAIREAIEGGLEPRRVLYFSFDEFRGESLRAVLRAYQSARATDLREGRFLVAFDEIQKLSGWEDELKVLYDHHKDRIHFLVSGSESLWLRRGMNESLAGRLVELRIDPFSFPEYLDFIGAKFEPVALHERDLERHWAAYSRTLGLPQLMVGDTPDRTFVRRFVSESITSRVLYKDLPGVAPGIEGALLESLYNRIAEEPGQVLEVAALSRELGAARKTISNYLWYLEMAFVIRKLYNYSKSRRKTERKLKRFYPTLVASDLLFRTDDQAKAMVLEGQAVNALRAEFFWRDPAQHEVDVVLGGPPLSPVEIKSGKVDTRGLAAFMHQFKIRHGWIVSLSTEEKLTVSEGSIVVLPAHKFFLAPLPGASPPGTAPLPVRGP